LASISLFDKAGNAGILLDISENIESKFSIFSMEYDFKISSIIKRYFSSILSLLNNGYEFSILL
jgi:hypothetical protein